MFTPRKAAALWNETVARVPRRERWATGLLVISSAALGGIAVALWNRHTLARMREVEADLEVTSEQMEFFEYE